MRVEKIINISRNQIPVDDGNVVHYLLPGQSLSDISVTNMNEIKRFCAVETFEKVESELQDLSEVIPNRKLGKKK